MLATLKNDKVDSATRVVLKTIPFAAETDSPAEKSTKPISREAAEIYVLLKPNLLEDMDTCAKLVDGVKWVIYLSSFVKHSIKYRRAALLAMMQKTVILVAKSMLLNQKDTKAANEVEKIVATEAYSSAEKIKRLEFKLIALKGSTITAPTSLQLNTARQEIIDLKTRLDAIQVKYESAEKEIGCYIPQIQDLERAVSELCSAAYAKDDELIAAYNQVIQFKKVVDKLEPQVLQLQGALKINESLKNEVDKLQHVRVSMLKENEQLNGKKARLETSLVQSQADFYKLGHVENLFGKSSNFEFAGKDFETFSISPKDLFTFTFEASIGEVVREVGTQAEVAGGEAPDDTVAESVVAAEGVATE
ncbi:hypothetical protein ACFX1T_026895 [Malus domestica]